RGQASVRGYAVLPPVRCRREDNSVRENDVTRPSRAAGSNPSSIRQKEAAPTGAASSVLPAEEWTDLEVHPAHAAHAGVVRVASGIALRLGLVGDQGLGGEQ